MKSKFNISATMSGFAVGCVCMAAVTAVSASATAQPSTTVHTPALTARQVSLLAKQVESSDAAVRLKALNELCSAGPRAAAAVPDIINALSDSRSFGTASGRAALSSPQIIEAAVKALTAIGPPARDAAPILLALLTDRTQLYRRGQVLSALNATGLDGTATPTILSVLGEEGKFTPTRLTCIQLLGKIDPPALEAVDALKEISNDQSDKKASAAAQDALKSINSRAQKVASDPQAQDAPEIADLRPMLFIDREKAVRLEALHKISDLEKKATPLLPTLLQMLNESDPDIQSATVEALACIGTPAAVSTPVLVGHLFSAKTEVARDGLCRAISAVDPTGHRCIPLVKPLLEDPFKARTAIMLLDEIGTEQSTALATSAKRRWCIK